MKNVHLIARLVFAVILLFSVVAPQCMFGGLRRYPYALILAPAHFGSLTTTYGINNHNEMVGEGEVENVSHHATIWGRHGMRDLGTLGGFWSSAYGINEKGDVVGWANVPGGDIFRGKHAFLWKNGAMIDLGTLGSDVSVAWGVNDNGVVVGISEDAEGIQWGFIWQDGKMFNLGGWLNPDGMLQANDINNENIVVGVSWSYVLGKRIATKRDVNGTFIPLPDLDGIEIESGAYAINDPGRIAGKSKGHAVIWEDGQVRLIENRYQDGSIAFGINNFGEVVGWGGADFGLTQGWVWNDERGNRLLNKLLPPDSGFWVDNALDINDNHQIVGYGHFMNPRSDFHGYVLTPVDPELVLGEPVPGVAGVVNSFTVTGAQPGAEVIFTYGMKGGGRFVPHCDVLDAVLQIDDAVVMGKGIADGDGVATIEMFVPNETRDEPILMMQAFDEGNCEESQLIVVSFE